MFDEESELKWVEWLGCGLECVVVWFHCDEEGCEGNEMGKREWGGCSVLCFCASLCIAIDCMCFDVIYVLRRRVSVLLFTLRVIDVCQQEGLFLLEPRMYIVLLLLIVGYEFREPETLPDIAPHPIPCKEENYP